MKYLVFSGKPIQFLTVLSGINDMNAKITLLYDPSHKKEKFGWNKITGEWVDLLQQFLSIELVPYSIAKKELKDRLFDYILFDWSYESKLRKSFTENSHGAKIVKIIHGCSDYYEYMGDKVSLYADIDEVWTLIDYPARPGRFYHAKNNLRIVQINPKVFVEWLERMKHILPGPSLEIKEDGRTLLIIHQNLSPVFMTHKAELVVYRDAIKQAISLGYTHIYWKSHYVVGHHTFETLQKEFPDNLLLLDIPKGVPLEMYYKELKSFSNITGLFSTALWTLRDVFSLSVTTLVAPQFMEQFMPSRDWWVNNLPIAFQAYQSFPSLDGSVVGEGAVADLLFYLAKDKQLVKRSEFRCKVHHFLRLSLKEKFWMTKRICLEAIRSIKYR